MKKRLYIFANVYKKNNMLKSHLHKYSDPLLNVEAPLAAFTALSYKLGTPVFEEFLPLFSADPLKLCQVGWGALLHSYFQVSPEMFESGWANQGHSETCPGATPVLSWLCA